MARSVSLRRWQREALATFAARSGPDFLAVACPGAGKTTFALAACRQHLAGEPAPVVVVVPTAHLKEQWAAAARRVGFHLDPRWTADVGRPADMHGVVVTYAQVGTSADALARLSRGGIVVLDEIHHAGDDRSWGDAVRTAFADAACRLLLSGTPFRSDARPIPFVTYSDGDHGEAVADVEYGYGEALADRGVVRPVFFPRFDGQMEWRDAEGEEHSATFDDDIVKTQWGARLRTALSLEGDWLPTVLEHANRRLQDIRRVQPDAAGLVIAMDQEHARGIARLLERRLRVPVRIALSDDPDASAVIARFAGGDEPWVVAVRMISEGVDIPRLRVGVYATTTSTPMFFRQAVGRIARWQRGLRSQRAYLYLPDDPRLRLHAATIAQQRRHVIEQRRRREEDPAAFDEVPAERADEQQLSLFAALSSTVVGAGPSQDEPEAHDGLDPAEDLVVGPGDVETFTVDLPPPPPLPGRFGPGALGGPGDGEDDTAGPARHDRKAALRAQNSARASDIARLLSMDHAEVNRELNRRAGIDRIATATLSQLVNRLRHADAWLERI
jgi:superfamily II DNA or RNA helicase